jgi:citrate lyase alpha subunit
MTKRGQHPNSRKNLENFSRMSKEKHLEISKKGAEASNKAQKEKKQRAEMCNILFDEIYKRGLLTEAVAVAEHKAIEEGDIKELLELLKLVKTPDKQVTDVNVKSYSLFEENVEKKANEID